MSTARLAAAGALALAALAAAGCSSSPATSSPAATAQAAASPAAAPSPGAGDCLFGAGGADVEVGIASPSQSCGKWVQDLAGTGLNWYPLTAMAVPGSPAADGGTYSEACDLTANGGEELYVEDTGGMSYGNSICSGEEANGWAPEGTPGPIASQEQQAGQQQAQASAAASAASASAAAAQAASRDDSQLNSDVAVLGKDYKTWSADVATANTAYQALKREPLCSGGTSDQNTYSDGATVYSDGATVYSDESALSNDVTAVQGDISSLQSARSAAGTGSYGGDIAAAQAALGKAEGAVNADESAKIQNEASAVQTATGSCT